VRKDAAQPGAQQAEDKRNDSQEKKPTKLPLPLLPFGFAAGRICL